MAAADRTHLLASRAAGVRSSAIRDLLALTADPRVLSLAGGLPAFETLPADDVTAAVAEVLATERAAIQYGQTEGDAGLRAWIASHELGEPTAERVLVTHGSQQALRLLVEALVEPDDVVVVERPSYLGMLQALATSGAEVVDVACDDDGIDVDELATLLAAGLRPKLCYLAPTFQNPSGSVLPDERRAVLGELAGRYGFVVIDDDPYRELGFGPVPSRLRRFVPDDLAVTLGSFSKTLAPGLRVGWVHGPAWLTPILTRLKQAADLHTNGLGQRVVATLVERPGWLDAAIAQRRTLYRARATAAAGALARHLPDLAVPTPRGGMFLWLDLGTDTDELLATGLEHGVAFVPGSAFDHRLRPSTHGRLCYATLDGPDLEEAARRLAAARASIADRCTAPSTPRS
jgi:2-aminoadipate transaminase